MSRKLIISVGCGGLFYHGLPKLVNFLAKRERPLVLLIDADNVEEKNRLRQWVHEEDVPKVHLAASALHILGGYKVQIKREMLSEAGDLMGFVEGCFTPSMLSDVDDVILFSLPDNHKCRVNSLLATQHLCHKLSASGLVVTGGNTLDNGYAYGTDINALGEVENSYLARHPEILEEAEAEDGGEAEPMSCGSLSEAPEQSIESNSLTSHCIMTLAEELTRERKNGELLWSRTETGTINIWRPKGC